MWYILGYPEPYWYPAQIKYAHNLCGATATQAHKTGSSQSTGRPESYIMHQRYKIFFGGDKIWSRKYLGEQKHLSFYKSDLY